MGKVPSAISKSQTDAVCKYLRQGVPYPEACKLAGVHVQVFRYWLRHGGCERFSHTKDYVPSEQAHPVYRRFVARIERAQAVAEASAVERIFNSPKTADLRWWLARTYPEDWGSGREKGRVLEQRPDGTVVVFIPDNKRHDGPNAVAVDLQEAIHGDDEP